MLNTNKGKIWIWGTGKVACRAMQECFDNAENLKGIIDNNIQKQGNIFYGYEVISFEEACKCINEKDDIIVICCSDIYTKEIEEQLEKSSYKFNYCIFKSENIEKLLNYCVFEENSIGELYIYRISRYLFGDFMEDGYEKRFISRCCTQKDFEREEFKWAAEQLKIDISYKIHRKPWEFLYIINVLQQYGLLREGMKALGFAVGQEPLPSYFASRHIDVLATDLEPQKAAGWIKANQNSGGDLEKLYFEKICNREDFDNYLSFRYVDMTHIPEDLKNFDFCWSSCAVEHVGNLSRAIECIKNMLKVLKPGGIAVNTTEYNLSSNMETIEEGGSVLFRKKDIEEISQWCKDNGHHMEISFKRGKMKGDRYIDIAPYHIYTKSRYHLNLMIEKYASTSFAIIIQKAKC